MLDGVTIPILTDQDIVAARQSGRAMAAKLGFSATDQICIATAISELSRNIVEYAKEGEIQMGPVKARDNGLAGVQIVARDKGPGIADVDLAMQDGYTSGGGLGLGLPGARRLVDEFDIETAPAAGTTVTLVKWSRAR